ncbi:C-C motif chemokine 14-like [Colossoma macropomum]|uniref:C-C motif chemokine 14-like n=1 Tax=Colossoma macropomum TaxID=42526 RepID=UPI001864A7B8|nr:C-C motif chemokine 14-like [Colossoma macropomum]
MDMKMSCVCLVLGLVLLMTISSDACPHGLCHPDLCCFNFITFKIPDTEILEVVKTHHNCPKTGYVFTTNKGKFCKEDLQQTQKLRSTTSTQPTLSTQSS